MSSAEIEGGWRERLIFDEFTDWLHGHLNTLGWFGELSDETGALPSITWRTTPLAADTQIHPNTLVVSSGVIDSTAGETGSNLTDDATSFWVDFYGSSDALAKHVTSDIRAICEGKYASIGVTYPGFMVTERRPASLRPDGVNEGDDLFWVEIEDVQREHAVDPARPELRHWYAVTGKIADENDS